MELCRDAVGTLSKRDETFLIVSKEFRVVVVVPDDGHRESGDMATLSRVTDVPARMSPGSSTT